MNNKLEKIIDKSFDNIVRLSPLPDIAEEAIILGKNVLTNKEVIESAKNIFDSIINKQSNYKQNENLEKLIDSTINELIKNKNFSRDISEILKENKEFLFEKILNKDEFLNKDNLVKSLDLSYKNWNEYFEKGDLNNMEKEYLKITKYLNDLESKIDVIEKAQGIKEMHELMKNKMREGIYEITDTEKELCRKFG